MYGHPKHRIPEDAPKDRLSVAFIEFMSIPEPNTGCWLWLGGMTKAGYGQIYNGDRDVRLMAHRVSYAAHDAETDISALEVHHKCQNPSCVNPAHLEALTPRDHRKTEVILGTMVGYNQFKTHCIHGHELIGRNLILYRSGRNPEKTERRCRICQNERSAMNRRNKRRAGLGLPLETLDTLIWGIDHRSGKPKIEIR